MKQSIQIFTALALVATTLLSCSKDDNPKDDDNTRSITKIDVSIKDGSSYSAAIDQVQLYYYKWDAGTDNYERTAIQKTAYNNGNFSIALPASLETTIKDAIAGIIEYEPDEDEEIAVNTIKVSDNNARVTNAYISTLKNNEENGYIEHESETGGKNYYAEYVYVDRDLTVTGKITTRHKPTNALYTMNYDLRLKKGWNLSYYYYTDSDGYAGETTSTSTSPGVALQWKFNPYSNQESSASRTTYLKKVATVSKLLNK